MEDRRLKTGARKSRAGFAGRASRASPAGRAGRLPCTLADS